MVGMEFERDNLHLWDDNRLATLARNLGQTVFMVCAQAGAFKQEYDRKRDLMRLQFDTDLVHRYWHKNLWPIPMVLHFHRLEQFAKHRKGEESSLLGASDQVAARILSGGLTP